MVIDFYLDLISPFVYLAHGRLLRIARAHAMAVVYHPVDMTPIRRNAGNTGPSNSQIPAKLKYMTKDRERWARLYGLPIARGLAGTSTGAFNRGLYLAAERNQADAYTEQASSMIWRESHDPGAKESAAELEARMGWHAGELAAFANSAETIERYAAEITAASAKDVFGVPTFIIGDEVWWGNDRLDFLEQYLAAQ